MSGFIECAKPGCQLLAPVTNLFTSCGRD